MAGLSYLHESVYIFIGKFMSNQCWKRNHTLGFVQSIDLLFCVLLYHSGESYEHSRLINLSGINPIKKWIYPANASYKQCACSFLQYSLSSCLYKTPKKALICLIKLMLQLVNKSYLIIWLKWTKNYFFLNTIEEPLKYCSIPSGERKEGLNKGTSSAYWAGLCQIFHLKQIN